MKNLKVSFVNTDIHITVLSSKQELLDKIDVCRKRKAPLCNVDLSQIELINIDLGGLFIENVIFNNYEAQQPSSKLIQNVNFKGATLKSVSFAHCKFIRCNFDCLNCVRKEMKKLHVAVDNDMYDNSAINISHADFFLCEFILCRFRRTHIKIADFRYSKFIDCSLGGMNVMIGDFYMAAFKGTTNFDSCQLTACSITYTSFENHCIRFNSINKLIQESYYDYSHILTGEDDWHKQNPCADFSCLNEHEDKNEKTLSKAYVRNEASMVYAQLSGIYAGKGFFKDSNRAYERAKINEAMFHYYSLADELNNLLRLIRKIMNLFAKNKEKPDYISDIHYKTIVKNIFNLASFSLSWILGFGYKLKNVIICFTFLIIGYSLLFHRLCCEYQPWYNKIAYSLNNSIGPFEPFTEVVGAFLSSLQTTIGILLIGFVGFVLANRIRNNY